MFNRLPIVALAVVLTGCVSAPQPKIAVDAGYQAVESAVHSQQLQSAPAVEIPSQPRPTTFPELERKPVDPGEQHCLAQALYWEARGEGADGMLAVASVIFNRVKDARFPDSVCDVVYQGGETPPCQFSWWCDGKSDEPANKAKWREVNSLAYDYLARSPDDPTDGALFYHAESVPLPWRRQRQLTARIGRHIFYR